MADYAESADVRRDAIKRKHEGLENSGILIHRMAMAECTSQGAENQREQQQRKKKKASRTATVDVKTVIDIIRSGIDERKQRESRANSLLEKIPKFDQEQAGRQAEQVAPSQRMLMAVFQAVVARGDGRATYCLEPSIIAMHDVKPLKHS
ncbi:hypothetical protein AC1031_020819 [Aphanomyces cochlioides]|nr:hypothetical protein AC1031_020819 [Aphanomyces cochlioides]